MIWDLRAWSAGFGVYGLRCRVKGVGYGLSYYLFLTLALNFKALRAK